MQFREEETEEREEEEEEEEEVNTDRRVRRQCSSWLLCSRRDGEKDEGSVASFSVESEEREKKREEIGGAAFA